jgi:nitric oxide reductase NorD protein
MEEQVGELWHKLITRIADNQYPGAAVQLRDIQKGIGIYFRALGGDSGLQIEVADATANLAHRSLLQRIAGTQAKIQLAWRDERSLRLPPSIAWFDQSELNTDLYYWLASLAAVQDRLDEHQAGQDWFRRSQTLTLNALARFPGIRPRYQRLLKAHLQQRPEISSLSSADAGSEHAIQQALQTPGSVDTLPLTRRAPRPVPLWLHPEPPLSTGSHSRDDATTPNPGAQSRELEELGRRQAEKTGEPEADRGLLTVRMENILTMGEFVNLDRGSEDEDDIERAENIARDLDRLAISQDGSASKTRLRFDLDLPSASEDDQVIDDGMLLPEWDWKKRRLLPDRCRIVQLLARNVTACALPAHLNQTARRLRNQFQAIAPDMIWHHAQQEGDDIDLDAYLRYRADRATGQPTASDNLYKQMHAGKRDLACLLLADLSLSTDAHIDSSQRIIDVIRDSLYLFAESLATTGDAFSILGFSSRKRDPIRIHNIKQFGEPYNAQIRGRIAAIKPGYYTRLGAAIRHATRQLINVSAGRRLLLVLTDGKPNDLDQYEGRYGIEDTRQAVIAARQAGLQPFCVTIDSKGNDYLPYLFSKGAYVVIRKPEQLPYQLPRLYALMTQ